MRGLWFSLCFVLLFSACSTEQRELRHALRAAGDNRVELEAVLEHYGRQEADTLKLRAAKYLIRYMPLHRSYDAKIEEMYDRIDSMISQYGSADSLTAAIEVLYSWYKPQIKTHFDVEVITADYLIRNIEQAFDLWKNKPWARYLDFDEFCEVLLPYKSIDMEPLADWRSPLVDMCNGELGMNLSEVWKDNPRIAADAVNKALTAFKYSYTVEPNPCPVFRARTVARLPKGTCAETSLAAMQIMRSKGIPVYTDFTPNWAMRPKNHFWLSVINRRLQNEAFTSFSATFGDSYFVDRPLAKVFRMVYRPNDELTDILRRDGWVPPSLSNLFVRDVTEIYMRTDDIVCSLYVDLPKPSGTVYLAVFNNQDWIPVGWGKRCCNKVRFERFGRNVFYMPVVFDKMRMMHPAGDPFFLGPDGEMHFMRPDTLRRRTIRLTRKYGIYEEINNIRKNLGGAEILAADNPQFRNARKITELPDNLILSGTESIGGTASFRYWQIRAKDICDIAELQFYEGNRKLDAHCFTETADKQDVSKLGFINDNDALTFMPLREPGVRVGFDFGCPVHVSKIIWLKRSDGNDVYPGFDYTLYYWNNRKWTVVEHRQAGSQTWLDFHNVPDNALLLLVCNTTGIQNRPFLYRDESVQWL